MILFFEEDVTFTLPDEGSTRDWVFRCIQTENKNIGELNFIFCSDPYLLKINRQYLKHDYFTDILTFDNSEEKDVISGDVFISISRVKENATDLGCSFDEELHRVIIHGVLHLIGFDDKTETQKNLMREKEEACLSLRN